MMYLMRVMYVMYVRMHACMYISKQHYDHHHYHHPYIRAMVTMQILAELEEVVEYKQIKMGVTMDLQAIGLKESFGSSNDLSIHRVQSNNRLDDSLRSKVIAGVDLKARKSALIRKWRGRLKWAPRDISVFRQILVCSLQ